MDTAGANYSVKILLIDDSRVILQENARVLQEAGYEVVCSDDGESALKMARGHKPGLILLDMILPKLSGPEVLMRLKKDPVTKSIPVVVLSSLSQKNRQKLMEAGAADYIEKSALVPSPGVNMLPKILEKVLARISGRAKRASAGADK